jgi:hypothetical protein
MERTNKSPISVNDTSIESSISMPNSKALPKGNIIRQKLSPTVTIKTEKIPASSAVKLSAAASPVPLKMTNGMASRNQEYYSKN